MASDNEACCESDPNFAVICGFIKKFGVTCGLTNIDFLDLQEMLENNQEVPQQLVDLHVKLLRKARKSVSSERWERAIIKLCYGFCIQDAWEIERFGYKKARLSSKLRILKELLEMQFDYNSKFKNEINKLSAEELRTQPLGRDKLGCVYWFQSDNSCQIRVYKDDPDEETWALVAKDREGLVNLISQLSEGKETVVNEDSNSLESEKPVVDTGQVDTNSTKTESMSTTDTNIETTEESNNQDEEPPLIKEEAANTSTSANLKLKIMKEKLVEEEVKLECSPEKEEPDRFASMPTTPPKADVSKKLEYTGVKEKYIRSDSTSSSVHHRKAVDSAGFDVHTNDLKRPIEEEEDVEEPTYVKHPRLDRPTLLSNKKKKPYSEDEDDDYDEDENIEEELDEEVSSEIVEPLMLVKGQGSGQDNNEVSPIIGETIEEPILYFCGEGLGQECETGNDNKSEDKDVQAQQESVQNELDTTDLKVINEASNSKTVDSINDSAECSEKLSFKIDYKLGAVFDVHANKLNSCIENLTKKSRCDIGGPVGECEDVGESRRNEVQALCNSSGAKLEIENVKSDEQSCKPLGEEETLLTPKKSMFFFGPGCLQVKPNIGPLKSSPSEVSPNSNLENEDSSEVTPPKEELAVEKCKTVTNRRKSDNPVKKVHEENLGLKGSYTEEVQFKLTDSDSRQIEEIDLRESSVQVLDTLSNNTLPANHHVPKNSISVFDKKVESVSAKQTDDSCNSKKCDVPVTSKLDSSSLGEKEKRQSREVLEVVGLPNIKLDKPKSKLENIVEKINQVKSIQKTDSVELGIKYKEKLLPDNIQPDSIKMQTSILAADNASSSNISNEIKAASTCLDNSMITTCSKKGPAPKLVKEKADIPLPLKKHLTKKSTINLENTQSPVQSTSVLNSQILCNNTLNTDKIETGLFISSSVKDLTEESKELAVNKSDCQTDKFSIQSIITKTDSNSTETSRYSNIYCLKNTNKTDSTILSNSDAKLISSKPLAKITEKPTVSDVNKDIDTKESIAQLQQLVLDNKASSADKQIKEENWNAKKPLSPVTDAIQGNLDKSIADLNDSTSSNCCTEDFTIEKPSECSAKELENVHENIENSIKTSSVISLSVETVNNFKVELKTERATKAPINDDNANADENNKQNTDLKESIQSRIFSSIDKSLNDAKCLIPQEPCKKKSAKDIVKQEELENTTDVSSHIFSSKPDKFHAKKLNKGDISLTDILSTSMKVPETTSPASYKGDELCVKGDLNDNDDRSLPESTSDKNVEYPKKESDENSSLQENYSQPKSTTTKTTKEIKSSAKLIKNKSSNAKQLANKIEEDPQNKPEDSTGQSEKFNTKRVTRRTRSNADKLLETDSAIARKVANCSNKAENSLLQMNNPQVCIKRIDQIKVLKKLDDKTDNIIETRKSGRIEKQEPKTKGKAIAQVNEENKSNKNKTVIKTFDANLEIMATNRELRERKTVIDKNKKPPDVAEHKTKSRGKASQKLANTNKNRSKRKQKNNNIGNNTTKLKEDGSFTSRPRTASVKDKGNLNRHKPPEPINVVDIEEQIIKNEIRVTEKRKSMEVTELTSIDKKDIADKDVTAEKGEIIPQNKQTPFIKTLDGDKVVEHVGEKITKEQTQKEESKLKEKNIEESKLVDEPRCIKKNVHLLTGTDTTRTLQPPVDDKSQEQENIVISDSEELCTFVGDDDNVDTAIVPEKDPLATSGEDAKASEPFMTLASFALDVDDDAPVTSMRITRKRAAQQSIDILCESRTTEKQTNIKRPKLKKKRSIDRNLRRSIEEKKAKEISSSEDDNQDQNRQNDDHDGDVANIKDIDKRRPSARSTRSDSPVASSDASRTDTSTTSLAIKQKKPRQMRKTLLGLEISPETESLIKGEITIGVRQSRRIAQLKIKEEAERRKLEEVTLHELKEEQRKRKGKKDEDKDYKSDKRKRNKNLPTEDETTCDAESDEKKKRKKRRKHRDSGKQFDVHNPWKSSSGSSSSEMDEDEEEDEEMEEDDHQMVYKSDHEFSPESDMEEGGEVQPLKRARTARKESDAEEEVDDCACQKCGQKDHPEWILLCDSCDCGWHCSCLRPPLLVIPEGDWFCPPCQHNTLVKNLQAELIDYDKKMNKREMEMRRKERLAYVGISLDNVLPSKDSDEHRSKHRQQHSDNDDANEGASDESDSDESDSDSESSSSSDSDSEPIYQLRERRQAHSYRFNDYDELINSAIQDDMDAVKGAGNQGRGKDISTIVNAEKEETELQLQDTFEIPLVDSVLVPEDLSMSTVSAVMTTATVQVEPLPPVVPPNYDKKPDNESDDEPIRPVRKIIGKKKHRKLNSLDVSSGDDAESDEDFKGSSTSASEEEDFEDEGSAGTDSSDELEMKRGKRRKDSGPIRRSTRARISRYDRDFINDDDSETEEPPRRKKTRSIWDESESEESDRSWGRRKRRNAKLKRRTTDKPKKSKKKKKKRGTGDDSDPEVYKKKPNIKFGGLNDEEEIGRRTRGKKINYLESLGTDSEDELRRKPPRIEESEDEYVVHEDEDFKHSLENDKDSDESGMENVLKDLPMPTNIKPKSRGRGKAGLKIPRKPKDPGIDLFAPLPANIDQQPPAIIPIENQLVQQTPLSIRPLLLEPTTLQEQDLQDMEDEPNPIEQINKNVEQMNEQEMEKMMEEEDYANKQLQLVALQIEKEKKRKEREAQRLEKLVQQTEQKIPKKRGRKPKNQILNVSSDIVPTFSESSLLLNANMTNNAELSEPPGISLPLFSEIAPTLNTEGMLKKRRGRGKGKKTLAAEAAAIAAAAAANKDSIDMEMGLEGPASSSSNTVSPAPDSPMHGSKLGIAAPPQPFSQSQPTPSVITRMLQSQPGQTNFLAGSVKYFGGPNGDPQLGLPSGGTASYHPGAASSRGPLGGPYQQPPPGMSHYPVIRSGPPPPHRLHSPGPPGLPPMYRSHRPMDPSPSGGGAINVSNSSRDRQSPAVVSPASNSPLSKGDPTPPPPPYTRPQVGHFSPVTAGNAAPRQMSMVPPHLQPHRASSMSPYHPGVPPNYHYGTYPPPPPLTSDDDQPPPGYPGSAYPEPYPEGGAQIHPSENSNKPFDEEGGEFVGLVSYFSSQREDDLDT